MAIAGAWVLCSSQSGTRVFRVIGVVAEVIVLELAESSESEFRLVMTGVVCRRNATEVFVAATRSVRLSK